MYFERNKNVFLLLIKKNHLVPIRCKQATYILIILLAELIPFSAHTKCVGTRNGFDEAGRFMPMGNTSLIKRTKRKTNFTVIGNEILTRTDLSFSAKGFLCFVLSLPDDWVLHKSHIKKTFGIGQTALDTIFDELEKAGYLIAPPMIKSENGKFIGKNYLFYDEPIKTANLENLTDIDFPLTENPLTENPSLLSTNTNQELTVPNKHTQAQVQNFSMPAVEDRPLPVWMARISGTVAERFKEFNKQAQAVGAKDGASSDVIEQLINTYGADDRQYPGFMRFETERYFDLQLMMRKFISQQEKYDERFS